MAAPATDRNANGKARLNPVPSRKSPATPSSRVRLRSSVLTDRLSIARPSPGSQSKTSALSRADPPGSSHQIKTIGINRRGGSLDPPLPNRTTSSLVPKAKSVPNQSTKRNNHIKSEGAAKQSRRTSQEYPSCIRSKVQHQICFAAFHSLPVPSPREHFFRAELHAETNAERWPSSLPSPALRWAL